MATAEELLMGAAEPNAITESNEEILVADLTTRVISIPATLKILGVESDDDVKRLQFKIPRYYGEFDLFNFKIQINFENERRNGDVYSVNDVVNNDDNTLSFSWLVDRVAFEYPGDVKFSICMKLYDDTGVVVKELNTTYATLPVLEGLETEKALVDQNPSAFDQIMYRLYAVEAATGNGQNGYYTVIKSEQDDTGVLFTIVNQDGESVAYVRNGIDGYTPVKGVDYWTPEDKAEVEEHAKTYVDRWAPVYKTVSLIPSKWSDNEQTVTVSGVTADSIVVVSPYPNETDYRMYAINNIRCVSQRTDTLTFKCSIVPTEAMMVNVAIYHSNIEFSNGITVTDDGEGNVSIM